MFKCFALPEYYQDISRIPRFNEVESFYAELNQNNLV